MSTQHDQERDAQALAAALSCEWQETYHASALLVKDLQQCYVHSQGDTVTVCM